MLIQPNITLRKMNNSTPLRQHIEQRIKKLEQFYDHISTCRVMVDYSQRRQEKGKKFHARIELTVPKGDLVVSHIEHEDPYLAIRDAFLAAQRRLKHFARKQRNKHQWH